MQETHLTLSLPGKPNKVWGTAESSAPPSFGAGSSAVTVNVFPATGSGVVIR
jgi:putative alpha-1,2-mannosidase